MLLAVFAAALMGGVLGGAIVALFAGGDSETPTGAAKTATAGRFTVEQTSAVADAAGKGRPSVVRIESTRHTQTGIEQDVGSGVVIDTEGHVVTNAHVVLGTETLKVVLSDGTERPAILIGSDHPFTDVAVLQIAPGNLTPVQVGDSKTLKLGETVVAVGNPLAQFDGSVTVGVVSGLNRVRILDDVRQNDLIQTDAALNSGNSGGALLNLQGQFVGMPTAVLRDAGNGSAAVEGIAFALPSSRLMPIVRGIITAGGSYPRPTIGADTRDLSPDLLTRLPTPAVNEGAIVTAIQQGGPSDGAGIQAGDIITSLDGQAINEDLPLLNALMQHQPGETVKVVLNRNGRIIEANVRLAKR